MPTLAAALDTYLKLERSPETNKQYRYILGKLIAAIGPARNLERITYEDLLDYLSSLTIAASTRSNYTVLVKTFFKWCVEVEYLDQSPARRLKVKKHRRPPNQTRAIPPDDLRAVVEYARVTSPRNYAALLFLADTACRIGGLLSLRLENLHIDEGYAWIMEKGSRWQLVHFGADTADALRRWLRSRPAAQHTFVWTGQGPDYAPLKDNAVRYFLRAICQKLGLQRVWFPHAFRHAVAFAWADAGVPPTVVQHKLGHADPSITLEFYYPETDERVITTSRRLALQALKEPDRHLFAPVPLPTIAPPQSTKTRKVP